jgi:hypothetical protein
VNITGMSPSDWAGAATGEINRKAERNTMTHFMAGGIDPRAVQGNAAGGLVKPECAL